MSTRAMANKKVLGGGVFESHIFKSIACSDVENCGFLKFPQTLFANRICQGAH